MLGYTREVLLQLRVADLIRLPPWADKVDLLEGVRPQLLAGLPVTYDTTLSRRDGSLIPVRQTLQRVASAEGFAYRATYSDLSGEKQMQLQAMQAEKQRLLQEIGSGLAHELNTPLAILLGNVEMAIEEAADPDVRALLTPARDAAQRISATVQSIQRFAKPVLPGTWATVDLSQLAAESVEATRQMWEERPEQEGRPIHVWLEVFPVAAVRGNPIELQEAIRELLANAVEALPRGGTIVVSTAEAEHRASLTVADNGVGMSEEVRARSIEPFFTTRRPAATGLGLNRVHHTVLRHHGSLVIESTEGEGSRITMVFPVVPLETDEPAPADAPPSAPPAG
jgi:signal transduction histidine kinase